MTQVAREGRRRELKASLAQLNQQFAAWVQEAAAHKKDKLWTDGARDYLKYAKELEQEYHDVIDDAGEEAAPALAAPSANGNAGIFGSANHGFQQNAGGAGVSPAVSFGSGGSPFTMLSPVSTSGAAADDDEAQRPGSPSLKSGNDDSSKALFQSKSKMFKLDSAQSGWVELGIGQLAVMKPSEGNAPSFIVFRNEAGKVLMRACLYSNLKVRVKDKSASMALFPAKELGESEGKPDPVTFTFRFGKVETVQDFDKTVKANCP